MPTCKNNSKRYYKGTEPSPKGHGWSAACESLNKKRKGKDGKMWQVKQIGNTKRWVKVLTKKHMTPKKSNVKKRNVSKKNNNKKQKIVIFDITFKWTNYGDNAIKRPSKKTIQSFFRSKFTKCFLDHYCQQEGVWIESRDPIQVFDHVVDMKNAKIYNCVIKNNLIHLEVQTNLKPYTEKHNRKVTKLTTKNLGLFSNCLKDVFNFSIKAGNFFSKSFPYEDKGEFLVKKITPCDWAYINT